MATYKYFILAIFINILTLTAIAEDKLPDRVELIYFHGDNRCPIDKDIEQLASEYVKILFSKQIKQGKFNFSVINFETEENKHYEDEFELLAQALILIEYENNKITKWTELDKVWELTDDPVGFSEYIKTSVNKYLGK